MAAETSAAPRIAPPESNAFRRPKGEVIPCQPSIVADARFVLQANRYSPPRIRPRQTSAARIPGNRGREFREAVPARTTRRSPKGCDRLLEFARLPVRLRASLLKPSRSPTCPNHIPVRVSCLPPCPDHLPTQSAGLSQSSACTTEPRLSELACSGRSGRKWSVLLCKKRPTTAPSDEKAVAQGNSIDRRKPNARRRAPRATRSNAARSANGSNG